MFMFYFRTIFKMLQRQTAIYTLCCMKCQLKQACNNIVKLHYLTHFKSLFRCLFKPIKPVGK